MSKRKFYRPEHNDIKVMGTESLANGGTMVSTYDKNTGTTVIRITQGYKETPAERAERIRNSPRSVKIPNEKQRPRGRAKKDAINKSKDAE